MYRIIALETPPKSENSFVAWYSVALKMLRKYFMDTVMVH